LIDGNIGLGSRKERRGGEKCYGGGEGVVGLEVLEEGEGCFMVKNIQRVNLFLSALSSRFPVISLFLLDPLHHCLN
jgi:hypothetical protein